MVQNYTEAELEAKSFTAGEFGEGAKEGDIIEILPESNIISLTREINNAPQTYDALDVCLYNGVRKVEQSIGFLRKRSRNHKDLNTSTLLDPCNNLLKLRNSVRGRKFRCVAIEENKTFNSKQATWNLAL